MKVVEYSSLSYPHSQHRRYVRGCAACLQRSRDGARRLTESRRRIAAYERARRERTLCWACAHPLTDVVEGCTHGR